MIKVPSSTRYSPSSIDLDNKNNGHTLAIDFVGENKRVLEIGTSTGYVSKILKEKGHTVIGIEIDLEAAEIASQICETMIRGDIENIDLDNYLEPSSFDVILCGDILEHIKYPGKVLVNLHKYLKSDGYLVVSLPNACHGDVLLTLMLGEFRYTQVGLLDETHLRFFGLRNIIKLFNDCGYSITDLKTTNVPVGGTELSINKNEIPDLLLKFIEEIPNTSVYQYVFKAMPSENQSTELNAEADINLLFNGLMDEIVERKKEPLLQRISVVLERLDYEKEKSQKMIQQITKMEQQSAEKEEQIAKMMQQSAEKEQQIAKIEQKNTEKEQQIAKMIRQIAQIEQQNVEMKRSISFWLTTKMDEKIIGKLFPIASKRRGIYDRSLTGGRIVLNEGFRSFLFQFRNYVKNTADIQTDYEQWISKNEPSEKQLMEYKKESERFTYRPKISIITPVYNPDVSWITSAIESVLSQVYDNWELCIADSSTKSDVINCLKEYSKKDKRIKVKFLKDNYGISGNSNEALTLATGEFIGFLDHDDEITSFALYEVIKLLNSKPYLDLIYSDEDKLDSDGKRCDPFFKPDWTMDLLLSCMYTCHLSIYRKRIIDKIGVLRLGYEGSQDYDLVLRFIEHTSTEKIAHIPKILYHWRKVPGSIASEAIAKNCINVVSGKKALQDFLERQNIKGTVVDGKWLSSYRIIRTIKGNPKVSIIIPTKDQINLLKKCIDSIREKTTYQNYELIVVNNDSKDPASIEYIKNLDCTKIDYNDDFNFAKMNNIAADHASGEYLIFLNNDIEITTNDWIESMLEHAQRDEVGAVGCKLLYPNGTIQHAGVILGLSPDPRNKVAGHIFIKRNNVDHGYFGIVDTIRNYSAVTAATMMIRKNVFEEVGGFDENLDVSYNDVDLCLKLRKKNYLIVYTPFVELLHHESASRGDKLKDSEVEYMVKKWGNILKNDPYYNSNLTLKKTDCELNV